MTRQAKGIYETNDGKLLRDRKACERHNAWLELLDWARSVISDATNNSVECADERELAHAIASPERAEQLAAIMKRKPMEAE